MVERRAINPWTWQDAFGFVQATEVVGGERVLYCSGQTSVDDDGAPVNAGDMAAQVTKALDNLERVLGDAGYSLGEVTRLNIYTTDVDAFLGSYGAAAERFQAAGARFTSTLLGVARLAFPELLVEIEATAVK